MKLDEEYNIVHYTGLISVRPIYSYFLVEADKLYILKLTFLYHLYAVERLLAMGSTLRSRRGACSKITECGKVIKK